MQQFTLFDPPFRDIAAEVHYFHLFLSKILLESLKLMPFCSNSWKGVHVIKENCIFTVFLSKPGIKKLGRGCLTELKNGFLDSPLLFREL
ncbi:hypothetical protein NDS46_16635 [Paenibacillus thiaminolyticus]|uniref:hypothetical protein n=1 Tax=Paenibacillus thiaminolyticus TaxID=49283 RepID=UPI002331056A|nr:hypothetical protein [Paenibacillus thiaminolyticus]WCF05996.1 hypothetical protein NDS46_16635 [Paenibacillus thiaminolyticus]